MRHFRRHERGRREPGHRPPRRRARPGPGPGPAPGPRCRGAAAGAVASSRWLPANGGCGPTARPGRSAARSRARPRPRFRLGFGFFPCETPSEGGHSCARVKRNPHNPAQPCGTSEAPRPPQPARSSPGGAGCWALRDGGRRPRGARDTRGPPRQPACAVAASVGHPGPRVPPGLPALPTRTLSH